jgi:hypothetical protein
MKIPLIKKLNTPAIINAAPHLMRKGQLAISSNNLVYLDVDDAYIHELFPLAESANFKLPDYFGEGSVGAHITVIYPQECKQVNKEDLGLGEEYAFSIKGVATTEKSHNYAFLTKNLIHRPRTVLAYNSLQSSIN